MTSPLLRQPARFARVLSTAALVVAAPVASGAQTAIPPRFTDTELWRLVADFSEPGGYFRSDNFLSNEVGYQFVIADLVGLIKPGGVYLGVGPEQNFTYIAALKPKVAIIFDIRRGNLIEHLMYKALFELSSDRADFLSRLFSRPRAPGLDSASSATKLFESFVAELARWFAKSDCAKKPPASREKRSISAATAHS